MVITITTKYDVEENAVIGFIDRTVVANNLKKNIFNTEKIDSNLKTDHEIKYYLEEMLILGNTLILLVYT